VNTSLESKSTPVKIAILADRASLFQRARAFFAERQILEVDCPALSQAAPIDRHIDVMRVLLEGGEEGYLHTSPEYGMKRLLALHIGDIYQLSHVFRDGEIGPLHNPEFTMAEWYRHGITFEEMIAETLQFIHLFLGDLPSSTISYREALLTHLGIDYPSATSATLLEQAQQLNPSDAHLWDKDTLLQLLVSLLIEPKLGQNELTVLSYFPASQAALAKTTTRDGEPVACRFEIYYRGIELANGYHELTDPIEQRKRLEEANQARLQAGKQALKIDERFLEALDQGLPDCCGVAVGFDRLMLLRHNQTSLKEVLPFTWHDA
jgi:lysyl-tRNA synthetase class 2